MSFTGWWCDMPRRGRYAVSTVILSISLCLLLARDSSEMSRVLFSGVAVGILLLVCTFFRLGED